MSRPPDNWLGYFPAVVSNSLIRKEYYCIFAGVSLENEYTVGKTVTQLIGNLH